MFSRPGLKPLIYLFIGISIWATGLSATIQVLVRILPSGAHVETIRVTVSSIRGGFLRTATLTDDRSFSFSGLRNGNYSIKAESPGFRPEESQVKLNSFARADHVLATVTLRRVNERDDTLPHGQENTVSVTTLSIPPEALDEMEKARKASAANDSQKALKHLKRAIELYPRLHQAYNNLAVEYTRLGQLEEAARALQKSIELQPDNATTQRNLAQLYFAFGKLDEALKLALRSLELEPRHGKSLLLLGEIYLRKGTYKSALDYLSQASDLDEANHSHIGIGQCLTLLGRYKEALAEFETFVERFPEDPRTPTVRTVIAQLETDLKEARP